jgi:glycosyltransferase involved in cell wall biosynthesis
MVHPTQGFAYWRILHSWMDEVARTRGDRWHGSRPILRLYDVSCIQWTGLNANRVQDEHLPDLAGQRFFQLPNPGTWQIAEVGFLLRDGEFVPAARSPVVPFAPEAPSRQNGAAALLVTAPGRLEHINSVWDQEHELRERRKPCLRHPLRIATLAFAARALGQDGDLATFVGELSAGQRAAGHEIHVFVPGREALTQEKEIDGIRYHPLPVAGAGPLDLARNFARAAGERLAVLPPFDLLHCHEWMTAVAPWVGHRPAVVSLGSIEAIRRNGTEPDELSLKIESVERNAARGARCVLVPHDLRDRAIRELGLDPSRVHGFPMTGRLPNEWECVIDQGQVKMNFGVGPLDRLVLFVGPLEHAAGVDLLVEALPVLLRRWGNLRLGFVGSGPMHSALERRANELGVGHAMRLLGHQTGTPLVNLVRCAEALALPSRYRIAMDDGVVELARLAGRPVVTTHGGPAHLIRHEETGLVTYDNPGSMVWALDRILGDPSHATRMGQNGRHGAAGAPQWAEVAQRYLEGCVWWFPELTVTQL